MRSGTRRFLPTLVGLALLASALPLASPGVAVAVSAELFFSEYIEGSSNNKALEIYNGTGAPVNLASAGYNVQMFFNGNVVAGTTINLTGTVANGDVFVLAHSSADATILAQADLTNGASWYNGDDAVVLRKGTTVLDVIGQIGFDPGAEWGAELLSTADNTLRRKATVTAGDPDGSDVFDPSDEWDGFATNTFDGLGAHSVADGLSIDDVTRREGGSGTTTISFTISLASPAGPGGVTFDIATADGTATVADGDYVSQSLVGQSIPEGQSTYAFDVLVNGDAAVEADETFFVNVTNITGDVISDGQGTGTIANDDADCTTGFTPIYDIQGGGASAALTGTRTTQGVVVGDFEGPITEGLQGFYLQDATGDGDPATSDGIFVFTGNNDNEVNVGDVVRVTGFARERFGQTVLNGSNSNSAAVPGSNIGQCNTTGTVAPVDVTLPLETLTYLERFEGMLVRLPQALQIAEYFNFDRFGEMVLALPLDGEPRPLTPTLVEEPGADAQSRLLANRLRRITLDDGLGSQNPQFTRHPNGAGFALDNRFRGGDTVANAVGVLGWDFNLYRIHPTGPADYTAVNDRPEDVPDVGGRLKVAAFNTLNFFLTLDYPTGNPLDNKCGPANSLECRGADFDQPDEFTRQRDKLIEALIGIDADVVGLNELENSTGVDPLSDPAGLLSGLNAALGPGTYAAIDTGVIGTDAIKVGLMYKPGSVTPVGPFKLLTSTVDPRFDDSRSRPALAQTFVENATGERFTVVVNHLKSKGESGLAPSSGPPGICNDGNPANDVPDCDQGDGQGFWNHTRKLAAEAIVDWLATDPTGSGDPDFLIIGDLNAYAMEDPIDAVKAGADGILGTGDDYTNLISTYLGDHAYSFVFDGMVGYLDHALSSTSLTGQVTGAAEWHINADEPDLLDYDTSFKSTTQDTFYEPNAYRSSDHDPVIVGLNLQTSQLTQGGSSCVDFANGDSTGLAAVQYGVKKGKINGVNPGAFAYWVQVQADAGTNVFTINQSITSGNFDTLFAKTTGSNVFGWDCTSDSKATVTQSSINASSGTVTVTFTAPADGTYYIVVKFTTGSVTGKSPPDPSTVNYEFSTTGVSPTTETLDLVRP